MFTLNEDLSIYATRGDIVFFSVSAEDDGKPYKFQPGDVLRIKVYGKKDAEAVVLQKDFPVTAATEAVEIFLTEDDTKIGEVISKPKDYWYEVELNPGENPQTIIGYDEDGAKVFKLFPEGDDIPPYEPIKPEDIPVVDDDLDLTSTRPVENRAIARAVVSIKAELDNTSNHADTIAAGLALEKARIDNIVSTEGTKISQPLEYCPAVTEETKAKIDGTINSNGVTATVTVNLREANLFYGGSGFDVFIVPKECRPLNMGLIHTEDGLEYKIVYDEYGAETYRLWLLAKADVTVAPSAAGTVTFTYALDNYELKDIRVGADGAIYPTAGEAVRKQFTTVNNDLAELKDICVNQSDNLYNPALQTEKTISPHYYVNGKPYSSTQYDTVYNCTAPIAVEQMTEYTVGLVPAINGYTAPWAEAHYGLFFYDDNDNFISGTTDTTFVTPAGTRAIRFNYAIVEVIPLDKLNANCMLVKGNALPKEYSAYKQITLDERVANLEDAMATSAVQYSVDGETIKVAAAYSDGKDILVTLKKKGGNNIFDFFKFATFAHGKAIKDLADADLTTLQTTSTDWHAPFIVKAVANIDGDFLTANHFTGGNHEYTNTGSGGTPTGRTDNLRFFADNVEITGGNGWCNRLEIKWTNYVQATNTKKVDGTGREVLKENHELSFDGFEWVSCVELVPIENVNMLNWYGLQGVGTSTIYKNIKYVGGENRAIYNGSTQSSRCGNSKATKVVCYGSEHKMEIEVDATLDLGDRRYYTGDSGVFAERYGKVYFNIIGNKTLEKDCVYCLRGKYKFSANS